ncbi:MAG: DNA repair protein RadA, partial [Candidatus Omnitrophica bacterium]|nr:DNA repair protein RadA [Candidatus Omnitrophota bacterium]
MKLKKQAVFICQNCGYQSKGFLGRCPECQSWDSMIEELKEQESKLTASSKPAQLLCDIGFERKDRFSTGNGEFDTVLGGGLVAGSVVLLGGRPGIGKSTIMLQVACNIARTKKKVLYVSGEESLAQIKMRATRLRIDEKEELYFLSETNLTSIINQVESLNPECLVLDSIQVVYHPDLSSSAGTISQVKESAQALTRIAKDRGIAVFLIGHVTKEGSLAGPMVLEHIVDTVLYFEGESFLSHRILRAIKNRFGSTNEIGLFEMAENGLLEVKNPSSLFMLEEEENAAGNIVVSTMEGTRPI